MASAGLLSCRDFGARMNTVHTVHTVPSQQPLSITLRGITNDQGDPGIDVFRTVTLPLLKRLGVDDGLELRVVKR